MTLLKVKSVFAIEIFCLVSFLQPSKQSFDYVKLDLSIFMALLKENCLELHISVMIHILLCRSYNKVCDQDKFKATVETYTLNIKFE